jgi:hypothetical protein
LKSISPSFVNGVVIGGITPVGRTFMGWPSLFPSRPRLLAVLAAVRSDGSSLASAGALIQLQLWGTGLRNDHGLQRGCSPAALRASKIHAGHQP